MKKFLSILLIATLLICGCITSYADEATPTIYSINNKTIIFDSSSAFSPEEQQRIAELIANPEYGVTQAGLMCTLFGHKNTSETVIAITHCAKANSPRCLQENFIVTTCSRCGETTTERASYSYITCCPED